MAADGAALVEARAGVTFGVELYVPWDAPEAVVDVFISRCAEGPGREILQRPPSVHPSVCPSRLVFTL